MSNLRFWVRSIPVVVLLLLVSLITPTSSKAEVNAKGSLDESLYPWVGMLYASNSDKSFGCTAILIEPTWVLTAAHCVEGNNRFDITFGGGLSSGGQVVSVDYFAIYPNYTKKTLVDDIAILHLSRSLPFYYVKLPPKDDISYIKSGMYSIGFGQDEKGSLSGKLNYNLQRLSYNINSLSKKIPALYYDRVTKKYSLPCSGDSGGPLVAGGKDSILLGVTSYGGEDCNTKSPAYYTRVSSYLEWIKNTKINITDVLKRTRSKKIQQVVTPEVTYARRDGVVYGAFIPNNLAYRYILNCIDENGNRFIFSSDTGTVALSNGYLLSLLGCVGSYIDDKLNESIPSRQILIRVS